jgi:hypothetical protein
VGKSTKTLGALPYPVFLDAFAGPFVSDSKIGNTKASVLPYIANIPRSIQLNTVIHQFPKCTKSPQFEKIFYTFTK